LPVSRHPARASRVGPVARRRTIRSIWSGSSAGPFTTTFVVASNLSVGSGVIVIFSCWAHLTASARFRAGPQGPVSGRLSKTASWRSGPTVVVSRRLSATGFRFSVILFPPRSSALLTVGLPAPQGRTSTGLPRSARTSYDRVGCPLYPGDGGAHPSRRRSPTRACRITTALSLTSASNTPPGEGSHNEASTRVQAIHPPGLPLACRRPDGTSSRLGFPPSFAPHPAKSRATHVGAGTGHRARAWNYTLNSHQSISNPVVHSIRATSRRTRPCNRPVPRRREDKGRPVSTPWGDLV
jgi:hypothetical protein